MDAKTRREFRKFHTDFFCAIKIKMNFLRYTRLKTRHSYHKEIKTIIRSCYEIL